MAEHTRLITYGRREDLIATSQTWNKDLLTGHTTWHQTDDGTWVENMHDHTKEFRQFVYMGPGIWFGLSDPNGDGPTLHLHIRLNHTTNAVPDWNDYSGPTDPNMMNLALSKELSRALHLNHCAHIVFKYLTLRFGGRETVFLQDSCDIEFDHVNIRAGSRAVRLENAKTSETLRCIRFAHCEIDGGVPTWLFRSDRKDTYFFKPVGHENEDPVPNSLASTTSNVLMSADTKGTVKWVTIHHCEIFNGHDTTVFSDCLKFHHNWINNLNDDSVYIGEAAGKLRIYQNVITQCLTAFSFSPNGSGCTQIFRNLVDIRCPTLGIRPAVKGDATKSKRQGQLYKGGLLQGPADLWNNTCVVLNSGRVGDTPLTPDNVSGGDDAPGGTAAGFTHYGAWDAHTPARRAFNNIFFAAYSPELEKSKPIAFLPHSVFMGSDSISNSYYRIGPPNPDVFVVAEAHGSNEQNKRYPSLEKYRDTHPGKEADSDQFDPLFKSFDLVHAQPGPADDFRLGAGSVRAENLVHSSDQQICSPAVLPR